ncbi:MAG: CHAT domain-containing protein [Bacteroidia bacterium]
MQTDSLARLHLPPTSRLRLRAAVQEAVLRWEADAYEGRFIAPQIDDRIYSAAQVWDSLALVWLLRYYEADSEADSIVSEAEKQEDAKVAAATVNDLFRRFDSLDSLANARPLSPAIRSEIYSEMATLSRSQQRWDLLLYSSQKAYEMNQDVYSTHFLMQGYEHIGDYERAIELGNSILNDRTVREQALNLDYLIIRNNIGHLFFFFEDHARAIDIFDSILADIVRALGTLPATGNSEVIGELMGQQAIVLANLAHCCLAQKNYSTARRYFIEAAQFGQGAQIWQGLGACYAYQDQYDTATTYVRRALDLLREESGMYKERAKAYQVLAYVDKERGRFDSAASHLDKALNFLTPVAQHDPTGGRLPTLHRVTWLELCIDRAELFQSQAQARGEAGFLLDTRMTLYQEILDTLDVLQREYITESRVFWMEKMRKLYQDVTGLALTAWLQTQDRQYFDTGFRLAERYKAVLLAEALRDRQARVEADIPAAMTAEEHRLRASIASYQDMLYREDLASVPNEKRRADLHERMLDDRRALEAHMKQLREDYPVYYDLKYNPRIPTVGDVQAQLAPDEALVEYVFTDSTIYALMIAPDEVAVRPVRRTAAFRQRFDALLDHFQARDSVSAFEQDPNFVRSYAVRAHALYQDLLGDLLPEGISQVLIVPDRTTAYLPFEALPTQPFDPGRDTHFARLPYLLHRCRVRYEYSSGIWLTPRQEVARGRGYAGFAPTYNIETDWKQIPPCGHAEAWRFQPLSETRREVEQACRRMGGRSYIGDIATEARVKSHIDRYAVLHFAAHAFTMEDCPRYAGLVLSAGAARDTSDDGVLFAHEIYQLSLQADLALLSACETGRGEFQDGEGVLSLARAFKYAGCANIVMTLWPIEDGSSTDIVDYLFEGLHERLPKDKALQAAKRAYLLDRQYKAHPYYWSSYVLVGDDLPLRTTGPWGNYVLLGGLFLLVCVVVWLYNMQR